MTTESEPTLKDIMASLSDIKTSVQNINGRLTKLDTSIWKMLMLDSTS